MLHRPLTEPEAIPMSSLSAASSPGRPVFSATDLLLGFAAGFIAVLAFHQPMLQLLNTLGVTPGTPYATKAAALTGVPQFVSSAFWGGLWGIAFAWVRPRLPRGAAYWLAALAFGAVLPTLVAWFVVAPLRGLPLGNGFKSAGVITALSVNGAWGVGTAVLLALMRRRR